MTKAAEKKAKTKQKKSAMKNVPTASTPRRDYSADLMTYLTTWATDRGQWKYNKKLQSFALENFENPKEIDKKVFRLLLPYIKSIVGSARDRLVLKVESIIADGGEQGEQIDSATLARKEQTLKRAAQVQGQL